MSTGPRILFLDIETSPTRAYVWGLHGENISIDQIIEPGKTISFAAKWLGDDKIVHRDIWKHGERRMLGEIYDLLDEADIVIHWNGTSFDIPTLNKEFVLRKWKPYSPVLEIDLLLTARSRFRFQSNRFGFVCKVLGIGTKLKHTGFDMWAECLAGDKDAQALMKAYNIHDTRLLGPVYERLKPWIKNHPNMGMWAAAEDHVCPNCGSEDVKPKGFYYAKSLTYQKYVCGDCGTWSRTVKNAMSSAKRKNRLSGV